MTLSPDQPSTLASSIDTHTAISLCFSSISRPPTQHPVLFVNNKLGMHHTCARIQRSCRGVRAQLAPIARGPAREPRRRTLGARRQATAAAASASSPAAAMAGEWLRLDRDPQSRAQVEALLAAGDEAQLRDLFGGRLEFGEGPDPPPRWLGWRRLGLSGASGEGKLPACCLKRHPIRLHTLARFTTTNTQPNTRTQPRPTSYIHQAPRA